MMDEFGWTHLDYFRRWTDNPNQFCNDCDFGAYHWTQIFDDVCKAILALGED